MDQRKELILDTIIKEHVKTGIPVGSGVLVEKYKLNISPATVRNEMADLENEGYILQPHTSAGRVPTEKAYRYHVAKLVEKKLSEVEMLGLTEVIARREEHDFKQTAKAIAALSNNAVFWAFHRHNTYYTGLANLLQQPEFSQANMIYDISAIIDQLDDRINEVFDNISEVPTISVGADNPFGEILSAVMVKYKTGNNIGVMGILGPIRMNYEKNLALIKYVHGLLNIK